MAKKMTADDAKKMTILLILLIVVALIVLLGVGIYSISKLFNNKNNSVNNMNMIQNEAINLVEYEYPQIDKKNIITVAGEDVTDSRYCIKAYDALGLFTATINEGKVYIKVSNLTGKFNELYPTSLVQSNTEHEVLNIENSATNIKIGYLGNSYMNPVLVVLQNNGNVSYVNIGSSLSTGKFEAQKASVQRVIRIENVTIDTGTIEKMGILLMQDDNVIYNLEDLI